MLNPDPRRNVALDKVEALRRELHGFFEIFDTTLDEPHPGYVRFRGRFLQEPADCFDEMRERFEQHYFTPMIRREEDRIALIALPIVFGASRSNWIVNLVLFVATIITTLFVGATYAAEGTQVQGVAMWLKGWPFSFSIMLILGAHELGHYFAARYHKVPVTLPYFIPIPGFSLIGTMGAFIRMKGPAKNRRALLDVGVAGPIAGMVFALPILLFGLATSEVGPPPASGYLLEGNSLLYALSKLVVLGKMLPADGVDVSLNQIAWAGWVGLFVTGFNLIPVGQLDGGHVAYVLLGDRARQLFWPVVIVLLALVLLFGATTWGLLILLLFLLGRQYAEPLDDVTLLDDKRKVVAVLTLVLFVLVFIPVPFRFIFPDDFSTTASIWQHLLSWL